MLADRVVVGERHFGCPADCFSYAVDRRTAGSQNVRSRLAVGAASARVSVVPWSSASVPVAGAVGMDTADTVGESALAAS